MRQFQGSLGPIQDLQPKHLPGPSDHQKNEAGDHCQKRANDIVAARKGFFVLLITGATMYTLLALWLS